MAFLSHIDHMHSDTADPRGHMTLGNYAPHQQYLVLNTNTEQQMDTVSCLPEKEILDAVRGNSPDDVLFGALLLLAFESIEGE